MGIDARCLRLGNWVLDEDNEAIQVGVRGLEYIYDGSDDYKPIPLTPEILEAAGFVEQTLAKKWMWYNSEVKMHIYLEAQLWSLGKYDEFSGTECRHIQHLHQLQNLYHALTGEELELNLIPVKETV